MKKTLLLAGAAALAMTVQASPGFAQEASEETELKQDVIVVSARKKDEGLLEAPVAVSAFSETAIEDLQLQSVDDIARFTPGLSFSKAFGRSTERPVIRGQSNVLAGVQFGVESGTAYFIDGVYYSGSIQNLDPNDLQRVEVIKGPQSALYGRNTYAGAINFITKGGAEEFEATAKARFGNNDTSEYAASIAGPLLPGLTGRLSFRDYEYGGEFRNAVTGELVGQEKTTSLAGVLDWSPASSFDSRLRVSYSEDRDGVLPLFLQSAEENNCMPGYRSLAYWAMSGSTNNNQYYCGVIKPGQVAVNSGVDADGVPNLIPGVPLNSTFPFMAGAYGLGDGTAFDGILRDLWVASSVSTYRFGDSGWELSLLGGYSKEHNKQGYDSDHSSVNFFLAGPTNEPFFANTTRKDVEDYSLELQLATPQDERLRGMVGVYLYDQILLEGDITFADPAGRAVDTGKRTVRNEAIFGLVEFDFTDRLTATLEGRYAEETKTDRTSTATPEVSYSKFTPRLTVDYNLTNGGTVYGVFAQGVKPGGINGAIGEAVGMPTYDQEESDNFELGIKTPLPNVGLGVWNLSLAGYFTDATNVQLTSAVAATSGAINSIATNQGAGEIKGLELDLQGAFNEIVSGGVTYAWTDAKFTEGCDADEWIMSSGGGNFTDPANQTGVDYTALFPGSGPASCNIAGRTFPLTSEHQASAFVRLDFREAGPFGSDFFVSSDLSYESSKFVQIHNAAETGDALLLGARFGFETDKWTLSAYGQNITDEDSITMATRWLQGPYFSAGFSPNIAPATASRGAPRAYFGSLRRGPQFGAELRVRF
ncbi:TonB-dependent receptor [Hyphomonas sp. WL0036]|uniref:TonB-dependent receptor n=1 Tax=Hyphomonas sediminis TaxID=2866160 RepID=UPI001C80A54D|nr:TonB-dependent receptor [Hyphomonas sediminis]MBY9066921.1 TonB-dependent receptor [Hyphomonas sediminis]